MIKQSSEFSVRATTGAFDPDRIEENLSRVAALADEEQEERQALEQEVERLREENAGLRSFADIGRRQYEGLRNKTAGRLQVLLQERPDDPKLIALERQVNGDELAFDELERLHARLGTEVRERFATRPEAQSTELNETPAGSRIDWSEFRIH